MSVCNSVPSSPPPIAFATSYGRIGSPPMFFQRLIAIRSLRSSRRTKGSSSHTGNRLGRAPGAERGQQDCSNLAHSYEIPGVLGFNVVREGQGLFPPIEKEGLQGGKSDNHEVGRPRPIHAPGIQQERCAIIDVRAQWVCHKAPWNRHRCKDGSQYNHPKNNVNNKVTFRVKITIVFFYYFIANNNLIYYVKL